MADNVQVSPGTGKTIAADEVVDSVLGTATVQFVKVMDGTIDGTNKAKVVDAGGLGVSLVDRIAGEDLDNDQLNVLGRMGRKVLGPYTAASVANNATLTTDIIDLKGQYPDTRRVTAHAQGDTGGNVTVHIEVSEDYTLFGAITAESTAALVGIQTLELNSSALRAVVTNKKGSAQNLLIWLVLSS